MSEPTRPGVRTEADVDVRIVVPYLAALGIQPDQVRAQHTFSLRLGRGMIHNAGGAAVRTGRLDYLIVRADGRPLFVVELKGPGEALGDDDRDQGISYARLVDPMAPLVLVSNGAESRLYDTITRAQLADPAAAALIHGDGRLTDDESLRARAEALEHFVGYSPANVAAFSRLQRAARMETLRGSAGQHTRKYETDLYLRRGRVRRAIEEFLRSTSVVFALGGASGFGKTNEMCAIAEELGETHVTLFFNGSDLAGSLGQALADEFDWNFSEALPLPQVCRRLDGLAARSGRPVLVFIDAVDEVAASELPRELADLATRLDAFAGQIRLVVSAKPNEWTRFTEFRGNPSAVQGRVFVPPGAGESPESDAGQAPRTSARVSALVGPFTPEERDEAIARYCAAFGLDDRWPYEVRELARDPFMLRMIAEEAAATGAVPRDSGERDLVRRYVDQKVGRAADPDRSRLELIAVARALAGGMRGSGHGIRSSEGRLMSLSAGGPATESERSFVTESEVRTTAGLPTTAPVGGDLVGFGVLLRSRDRDGNARLAFAYDRVRDYMVATHALMLPDLGRDSFRAATIDCFATEIGAAALYWYLPYTTDEQWAGFVDGATHQVERLLTTYEALRSHLAPPVRAAVEPRNAGAIGVAFSAARHRGFALGFFRRESESLPRVCFDAVIGDFGNRELSGSRVPFRLMGSRHGKAGFWYLRAPELYAATRMKEELERVAKEGLLCEQDATLVEERVVALAITHASKLNFRAHTRRREARFADRFVGRQLLPLDLRELRRVTQIELAFRAYQDEHMRERYEEELRKHRAAGAVPERVWASSNWTDADLRAWRERATREVEQGRDFTQVARPNDELTLLAVAVNTLLEQKQVLEEPLLPPPDAPDDDLLAGVHNFEDGYSDDQLARLVETVFDRALRSYDHVLSDSFSDALRSVLPPVPFPIGVLCFRRPLVERLNEQFSAGIGSGVVSSVDYGVVGGKRAIGATVSPEGTTRLEQIGPNAWDGETLVTTRTARFHVRIRRSSELISLISPWDAPPFVRDASGAAARLAPVRAMIYEFAREALADVSPEQLLALVVPPSR